MQGGTLFKECVGLTRVLGCRALAARARREQDDTELPAASALRGGRLTGG
jgi:hypothetical protein